MSTHRLSRYLSKNVGGTRGEVETELVAEASTEFERANITSASSFRPEQTWPIDGVNDVFRSGEARMGEASLFNEIFPPLFDLVHLHRRGLRGSSPGSVCAGPS